VATGCGTASIVLLALAFGGGYVAAHGGAISLMDWFLGRAQSDLAPMFTKDVTPVQHQTFDREMGTLRQNVRAKRVSIESMQPLLGDLRDAMLDENVTAAETKKLITDLQTLNRVPPSK
jgi:hypothetical protein